MHRLTNFGGLQKYRKGQQG